MMNVNKYVLSLIALAGILLVSSNAFATPKDISFIAECPTVANFLTNKTIVYSTVNNSTIIWEGYNGLDKIQSFKGLVFGKCSPSTNACSLSCVYATSDNQGNIVSIVLKPMHNSYLLLTNIPMSEEKVAFCKNNDPAQCQFNAFQNNLTQDKNKALAF